MKARLLAAMNAVFFHALVLILGVLLLPLAVQAAGHPGDGAKISPQSTPEEFIEYASINDQDVHEVVFGQILWEGTESCLVCHQDQGEAVLKMGHFKWEGKTDQIVGLEGKSIGKNQLLNNFCVAVPSNEGRCTQCHAGYGYADKNFNFDNPANVDCLACHDHTGTYKKGPKTAGMPDPSVDLNAVARSVSASPGLTRAACIRCHAFAGGDDNVKHGDLSSDLIATTREYDVHMGTDGANLDCVACHGANHDPENGKVNHGMAGMEVHSVHEGEMKQCADCHGSQLAIHADTPANLLFEDGWHQRLACQVCHIPAIARKISTKVEWYWSEAGQDITPPIDPDTGRATYNKMKGSFVWKNNVRPVLRYYNGKWERKVIGLNDTYDSEPIQLAVPQGAWTDPGAMIYPFKKMVGNQPVDPVNGIITVPHLFGTASGPNPYWGKWDWNLALQDGAAYTGRPYSGTVGFASTEMLLRVNHEVATPENALGVGPVPDNCMMCHYSEYIEWDKLGWTDDPLNGGQREGQASAISRLKAALE